MIASSLLFFLLVPMRQRRNCIYFMCSPLCAVVSLAISINLYIIKFFFRLSVLDRHCTGVVTFLLNVGYFVCCSTKILKRNQQQKWNWIKWHGGMQRLSEIQWNFQAIRTHFHAQMRAKKKILWTNIWNTGSDSRWRFTPHSHTKCHTAWLPLTSSHILRFTTSHINLFILLFSAAIRTQNRRRQATVCNNNNNNILE